MTDELEQKLIAFYLAPHSLQETAWVILHHKCTKATTKILQKHSIPKHNKATINKIQEQTSLVKYGTKNPSSSKAIRQKVKQTVQKRYGTDNVFQAKETKEKIKMTCLKKYGATHFNKTETGKVKHKITCLKKYGVESQMQAPQVKAKAKQTCLRKYGVDNYAKTQAYKDICKLKVREKTEKQRQTRHKNKTFNVSSTELAYQHYLELKYGKNDILTQYYDERYPFNCDFYIKSKDLFIELNLTWTHGGKLYEGTEADLKKLAIWTEKAKQSKYYQNAIYTWTDLDIRKDKYIKLNNLNFIRLYSKKDLYNKEI